jgi:hypothetical protein
MEEETKRIMDNHTRNKTRIYKERYGSKWEAEIKKDDEFGKMLVSAALEGLNKKK